MKRSEINRLIRGAEAFFTANHFSLPPFAQNSALSEEIVARGLGWDVTDFGRGDFDRFGLILVTLRNGAPGDKPYCEKIMRVAEEQRTPTHRHHQKIEDIIVRGTTGALCVQLWNATDDGGLAETPVTVQSDGIAVTVPAGGVLTLEAGQSVCLPRGLWHQFWGRAGTGPVLVGEVSSINDDASDNDFYEPAGRFPALIEDEPPYRLLVADYPSLPI